MMRHEMAKFLAAVSGIDTRSPKAVAIDTVLLACKLAATQRPEWWRWTVWMAGAISCKRIEAI